MAYYPIFENYFPDIYVHIEKFNKDDKSVLFDFVDSGEFEIFRNVLTSQYDFEKSPTMVLIKNYSLKPLREGSNYRISTEILQRLILSESFQIVEDSYVIGFVFELSNDESELFGNSISFSKLDMIQRNIEQPSLGYLPNLGLNFSGDLKVIVKNVGQGSWNEIEIENKKEIVFDIGTIYTTSKASVNSFVAVSDPIYQNDKPIVIISHWDVDHYHLLIGLSDAAIQSFKNFICRNSLPNLTSRKIYSRINSLNASAVITIPPEIVIGRRYSMKLVNYRFDISGNMIFFNGSFHSNRNKSGIGFLIRKSNTSVVFSADFDYSQVSDDMLPFINYKHKHYLIVPHHGGKAGNFRYNTSTRIKLCEAVISVGPNPYRPPHPWINNINSLTVKGFQIIRTDILGRDHIITVS